MDIQELDLASVTRTENQRYCQISVQDGTSLKKKAWISCGEVSFSEGRAGHTIRAYLNQDATDFEHDSALAFSIPIIGLTFVHVYNGTVLFRAFIAPPQSHYDWEDFRVPREIIDLKEATQCDYCEDAHPIVEYLPEANPELYRQLSGREIEIFLF